MAELETINIQSASHAAELIRFNHYTALAFRARLSSPESQIARVVSLRSIDCRDSLLANSYCVGIGRQRNYAAFAVSDACPKPDWRLQFAPV